MTGTHKLQAVRGGRAVPASSTPRLQLPGWDLPGFRPGQRAQDAHPDASRMHTLGGRGPGAQRGGHREWVCSQFWKLPSRVANPSWALFAGQGQGAQTRPPGKRPWDADLDMEATFPRPPRRPLGGGFPGAHVRFRQGPPGSAARPSLRGSARGSQAFQGQGSRRFMGLGASTERPGPGSAPAFPGYLANTRLRPPHGR